ncbi:MAG: radical SAM protein, partial [Thermoflexia bacterium]
MPRFLTDLERGTPQQVYRADGFADMRQSPVPLWELVDMRRYASLAVQCFRGCPFDCEFCNITALLGRTPRTKSAEQVVAELDRIYSLGWRGSVFFVDDDLIGDRRAAKNELLPALTEWRKDEVGIIFSTQVSINL